MKISIKTTQLRFFIYIFFHCTYFFRSLSVGYRLTLISKYLFDTTKNSVQFSSSIVITSSRILTVIQCDIESLAIVNINIEMKEAQEKNDDLS